MFLFITAINLEKYLLAIVLKGVLIMSVSPLSKGILDFISWFILVVLFQGVVYSIYINKSYCFEGVCCHIHRLRLVTGAMGYFLFCGISAVMLRNIEYANIK